jgi:hypothetical protein
MLLKPLALSLALTAAIAMPASAGSLRRASAGATVDADSWSFIATHVSTAGPNNQVFVNDIPMGPYATEVACVAVMKAYQPDQPPPYSDFVPYDGIFKTSCCIDNTTGAKDCGTN